MILSLMSHNEARSGMTYWAEKHQPIFKMIRFCLFVFGSYCCFCSSPKITNQKQLYFSVCRETMGLKQFSVEDIDTVLGVFLVNDFEINSMVRNLVKDNLLLLDGCLGHVVSLINPLNQSLAAFDPDNMNQN